MENVTITLTPQQRVALEWVLMNEVDRLKDKVFAERAHPESVRTFKSLKSIQQIFEIKRDLVAAENELDWLLEENPEDHKAIAYCAKRVAAIRKLQEAYLKTKIQN